MGISLWALDVLYRKCTLRTFHSHRSKQHTNVLKLNTSAFIKQCRERVYSLKSLLFSDNQAYVQCAMHDTTICLSAFQMRTWLLYS